MNLTKKRETSIASTSTTTSELVAFTRKRSALVVVVSIFWLTTFQFYEILSHTKVVFRELESRCDDGPKGDELMEHDANHTQDIIKLREQVPVAGQENQERTTTTPVTYKSIKNKTNSTSTLLEFSFV